MTRLAPWLAAVALSVPLAAQLPPGSATAVPDEILTRWLSAPGTARKVVGAFWHSTDHLSAIGLHGTSIGLVPAPAVSPFVKTINLGATAVDCVTLPGAGLPGVKPRDALLATVLGPGDELRMAWTDANGATVTSSIAHPGWLRAIMLHALGRADSIHVAGRSQGGQTLLRTVFDRALGQFAQLPAIQVGTTIDDLCLFDLGNDSSIECAVLTSTTLTVYAENGAVVSTMALAHAGGAVEPLCEPGAQGGLALLRRNAADNGWELVRIMDGVADPAIAVTMNAADYVVRGFAAGDMNGDGRADVAIQDDANRVRLVENDPAASPPFAAAGAVAVKTLGPAGAVQQPMCVRDFDHDGAADVLAPLLKLDGGWVLGLLVGLPSAFDPLALTFEDIFTGSFHEQIDPENPMQVDWFKLGLSLTDYLQGFATVSVTFYWATESENLGESIFAEAFDRVDYDLGSLQGMPGTHIPPSIIDRPQLLFLCVQFSDPNNPDVMPTFLAGATIDNSGQTEATSAYLLANLPQGTQDKPVERSSPGRKRIGLIAPQPYIPAGI